MIFLLYILYAKLNSEIEAFLYSRKGADALPANEHKWTTAARFLPPMFAVAGLILGIYFGWTGLYIILVECLASAAGFSYWHNGWYYLMRDRIDGTSHGWRYQSPTDTAKNQYPYPERVNGLKWSVVILIAGVVLYYVGRWVLTYFNCI